MCPVKSRVKNHVMVTILYCFERMLQLPAKKRRLAVRRVECEFERTRCRKQDGERSRVGWSHRAGPSRWDSVGSLANACAVQPVPTDTPPPPRLPVHLWIRTRGVFFFVFSLSARFQGTQGVNLKRQDSYKIATAVLPQVN